MERPTMAKTRHTERHFTAGDTVRDIVIGMSDGLTVPFALAAGLTGAISSSKIIITAGFAEIAAGSIAMGLGGYLAAKSDAEHYQRERQREKQEVAKIPDEEMAPVVNALSQRPRSWVDFMMRYELGLEKPDPKRAITSAVTIAGAYIAGGLIPLSPYILLPDARTALRLSVLVTLAALLIFGYVKSRFTGTKSLRGALQTMLIGGLAAAAAFGIARAIS